ncbi:MAG: uracil-DNA glycosylase [Nitrospinae bacterium]|nr:uracil-DNA glycosylase [Nitrospinota bacterium]
MSGARTAAVRLAALKSELETLRLHGHENVEGTLQRGLIERLSGAAELAVKTEPKTAPPAIKEEEVKKRGKDGSKREKLAAIEMEVGGCVKCGLCEGRTNTVFGVGDPEARLLFIGEAPGAEEDKKGEPFVGRAGQLLTKMIGAMGLSRETVYIANIIKCRPPENRNPLPGEVEMCEPYLLRQIEIIRPAIICALGAVAANTLLKNNIPISKLRGDFHSYHGTPLLPTFHPAYLLRNESSKKDAWSDLQLVMKKLGLKAPAKKG